MRCDKTFPRARCQFFDWERQPLTAFINAGNDCVNFVVFLKNIFRMFNFLVPSDVGNMNESVNSVFEFDKCAEFGQITNFTANFRADRIFLVNRIPRIFLKLFHSEADAAFIRVNSQNLHFDIFTVSEHSFRCFRAFRPRNFRNVNQAFNARFEFDKHAVVSYGRNFSGQFGINRINFDDGWPRIGKKLLKAERNFFLFAVEFQDFDLNIVARFENVARTIQSAPRHIGNVQQSVNAADVNKCAVFGQIFNRSLDDVTDFDTI